MTRASSKSKMPPASICIPDAIKSDLNRIVDSNRPIPPPTRTPPTTPHRRPTRLNFELLPLLCQSITHKQCDTDEADQHSEQYFPVRTLRLMPQFRITTHKGSVDTSNAAKPVATYFSAHDHATISTKQQQTTDHERATPQVSGGIKRFPFKQLPR